jgi:hypothetical protein
MTVKAARTHSAGGAVMFLRAEQPLGGSGQCFLRYRHTPNLLRLRKQLLARRNQPFRRFPIRAICLAVK